MAPLAAPGLASSSAAGTCCRRCAPGLPQQPGRQLPQRAAAAAGSGGGGGGEDGVSPMQLDLAAGNFAKGLMAGTEEDELVAQQLGAVSVSEMSDVQEQYKDAIKRKLQERAEELQREREVRAVTFSKGKLAYERGQYSTSARLLEQALNEEGPFTQMGGQIQLWLALAYQACGREEDCLETYRTLEQSHPLPAIRRQANDLRYIMEAPKLQINPDERVQIPLLTGLEANRGGRFPVSRARPPPKRETKVPKTWDEEFWENYSPPEYLSNRYVWAAATAAATVAAVYSSFVQRGLIR